MSSPISTPKGGGAQSGLGEKFSPDLFTGTGNFSVPVALPPGRNGFQPELSLQYSTGNGNSPFGLGWNLSIPGVMRKTAKGVPQYDDEKDTFILSGAEDLIAVKRMNIRFGEAQNEAGIEPLQDESGIITQFRPRTEGLFAKIYHLKTNQRNCWKVLSKDGLTSWYGSKDLFEGDLSVVYKPDYPASIFAWKLTLTEDTFGNHILYTYEKEQVKENTYHKWDQNYLKEIKYADYPLSPSGLAYMVRILFTYENRSDAFSDYKCGFDLRTTQRCKNIQVFTNPVEGEIKTRTYHFQYSDEVLPLDEQPYNGVSLLCDVEVEGHDGTASEFLPPLEFRYTHFKLAQQKFRKLEGPQMPLTSLANPGFELIDLFGNGLPDIVHIGNAVQYWRNLGNGKFDAPRQMKDAPAGIPLAHPDVQLVDANGDGRTDLLVNSSNIAGYFSMKHNASWDSKAFKKYKQAPSFSFADPEVKTLDLTGDGITDALRNGSSFECFFHDKNDGWTETRRVPKRQIEDFPNVSFADPHINLADMTGDGLQDIVQVHNGSIRYWPNLGYGNFGKPVAMKNAPRLPAFPFDPARVQLGDVDGDGQADLIYVDAQKITFWINQSGNGWSEPFEITGTPFVTNINGIRVADIYGNGVSGVLYSFDAMTNTQRHNWYFLDLTGGTKPYLLHEMDNNMGALTRVHYLSSTRYYLKDEYGLSEQVLEPAPPELSNPSSLTIPFPTGMWKPDYKKRKPWKTTLPFPVQVVSKVEVIDQLSKGKLTTRYVYHHGYWDGGEREFRGFGRVDQKDTEQFERHNMSIEPPNWRINPRFNSTLVSADGKELEFEQTSPEHYSPPVEMRNWFHLGPIGDEFGDWMETEFSDEYWQEDKNVLQRDIDTVNLIKSVPRRAKRDAYRAWRGSSLRTELYALDRQESGTYIPGADGRPYTITENQYGLRLEAAPAGGQSPLEGGKGDVLYVPKETSGYIFFSFATASRTTQWERGNDPMTQFSFTTDYDEYGLARKQLSAALPRGIQPPYDKGVTSIQAINGGGAILSTLSTTSYAQKNEENIYIIDRVCRKISYKVFQQNNENVFELRHRVFQATLPVEADTTQFKIISGVFNFYDGSAFTGESYGTLGEHGALVRSETLILTPDIVEDAYEDSDLYTGTPLPLQDSPTWTSEYPTEFRNKVPSQLGYQYNDFTSADHYTTGWYSITQRMEYDFHSGNGKGLMVKSKDPLGNQTTVEYDDYELLPVTVTQEQDDAVGEDLTTTAEYDYRVLQAKQITEPNGNRSSFVFNALGLLKRTAVMGKSGETKGDDIDTAPGTLLEYDFLAFMERQQPVSVKTIKREYHTHDADIPAGADADATITTVEYTDGFGRLLQTRTQAEDIIFGDPSTSSGQAFGSSGLPEDQGSNAHAIGIARAANAPLNVVVSGWQVYNNKGKVVEQYEPFFSKGFSYTPPSGEPEGAKVRMYYDPRGQVVRTINPDGSEQWVIFGIPDTLSSLPQNTYNVQGYKPTPWESYTYDANDLAPLTHSSGSGVPASHHYTPSSSVLDALGRTIKTIDRNGTEEIVMQYEFDIRGNLLKVTDALDRIVFLQVFDLRPKPEKEEQKNEEQEENLPIQINHIDRGITTVIFSTNNQPVETRDAKEGMQLVAYDEINRLYKAWSKDDDQQNTTLKQHIIYGDATASGLVNPEDKNHLERIYKHYDEAGLTVYDEYDFKGNVLEKTRQVIEDTEFNLTSAYQLDWNSGTGIIDSTTYKTNNEYDALNRVKKMVCPEDVDSKRKVFLPSYNRAGNIQKIDMLEDNNPALTPDAYIEHIAYNAKTQKILLLYGNQMMSRYAYDNTTFRLKRLRTEKYSSSVAWQYEPDGAVKQDLQYHYDLMGNITGIKHRESDSGIGGTPDQLDRTFKYDPIYRLIEANGRECNDAPAKPWDTRTACTDPNDRRAYTRKYSYDEMGNILELQHIAGAGSFTREMNYVSGKNQLANIEVGANTYQFEHDDNGNIKKENSNRYFEWGYGNRLRFFKNDDGSNISVFEHYLYDAQGQRVKKYTQKQNGDVEVTVYIDGMFEHRYQKDNTGTVTAENNELHIKDTYTPDAGQLMIANLRVGNAFSGDNAPAVCYIFNDHLGNTSIRLDENRSLVDREEYYPFGDSSLRTFSKKRYRYNGKEKDEHSGLYHYGSRYYSPWTCRFTSSDTKWLDFPDWSAYHYAQNNPVKLLDINGEQGGDGPFTGMVYKDAGGIKAMRVTTQDRVAMNVYKNVVYALTGFVGATVSFSETAYNLSKEYSDKGLIEHGLSTTSAGTSGIDVAMKSSGLSSALVKGIANGISMISIVFSAFDNAPTQQEQLVKITWDLSKQLFKAKEVTDNILLFGDSFQDIATTEDFLNSMYSALEKNLSEFDLTTEEGWNEAINTLSNDSELLNQVVTDMNKNLGKEVVKKK